MILLLTFYGSIFVNNVIDEIKLDSAMNGLTASIIFIGMTMISMIIINIFVDIVA